MLQSEFGNTGFMPTTGSCASSLPDFGWSPLTVAIPAQTLDRGVQRPQIVNSNPHLLSSRNTSCPLDDGGNNGDDKWMRHSHYQPPFPFYGSTSGVGHWYAQYPQYPHHQEHIQLQQQQHIQQKRAQQSSIADRRLISDPINLSMSSGHHHLPTTNFDRQCYQRPVDNTVKMAMLPGSPMYASTSANDRLRPGAPGIAADVTAADAARGEIGGSSATASNQFYVSPQSSYERSALMNASALINATQNRGSYGAPVSENDMDARWYGAYFPAESVPSTASYSSSGRQHLIQLQRPNAAASSLMSSASSPSFCREPSDAFSGTTLDISAQPQLLLRQPMTRFPDDGSLLTLNHQSRSRHAATTTSSSSSGSLQPLQFKQESSDVDDDDDDDDEGGDDKHRFAFGFRPTAASMSIGKTRTREKYRTVYNERQKVHLEAEYVKNPYISAERKASISQASGLSQRQVKIWFQNRRAKDRRTRYRNSAHCTSTSN